MKIQNVQNTGFNGVRVKTVNRAQEITNSDITKMMEFARENSIRLESGKTKDRFTFNFMTEEGSATEESLMTWLQRTLNSEKRPVEVKSVSNKVLEDNIKALER